MRTGIAVGPAAPVSHAWKERPPISGQPSLYRWFGDVGIEDKVRGWSVFSGARDERFRDDDIVSSQMPAGVDAPHGRRISRKIREGPRRDGVSAHTCDRQSPLVQTKRPPYHPSTCRRLRALHFRIAIPGVASGPDGPRRSASAHLSVSNSCSWPFGVYYSARVTPDGRGHRGGA
jgi:hypothetical protein